MALRFNGKTDYIEIPDNNVFSVPTTGEITISAWIRPDVNDFPTTIASGDGAYIDWLGKGDYLAPTQFEYNFRMYNKTGSGRPNRITFYVFNINAGNGIGSYFQDTVVPGEWIHVIGAIDATKTYIYKNGTLRDSDIYTATITPTNGIAPLLIGTTSLAAPSFFLGAIKDVIIFNRKITDNEALTLFSNNTVPSGAIARYLMDDRNTIAIKDHAGNYTGTNHGALPDERGGQREPDGVPFNPRDVIDRVAIRSRNLGSLVRLKGRKNKL